MTTKKKWHAYAHVEGGQYVGEFMAETKEETEEMAAHKAGVSLCHQCARQVSDIEVTSITVEED